MMSNFKKDGDGFIRFPGHRICIRESEGKKFLLVPCTTKNRNPQFVSELQASYIIISFEKLCNCRTGDKTWTFWYLDETGARVRVSYSPTGGINKEEMGAFLGDQFFVLSKNFVVPIYQIESLRSRKTILMKYGVEHNVNPNMLRAPEFKQAWNNGLFR